ncbi:MAG: tetratricopeptide repeat protein [Negativicutes bacterium]|jgi:predicted O-linked N-acetylglucosamine transferase (SPINDLY family)
MKNVYAQALQLLTSGQLDQAEILYNQLLTANVNCDLILNDLGVIYFMRKDYQIAAKYYEAALLFDPHNAKTNLNYGNTLREIGNIEQAERIYNLAFEYNPDINWKLRILEQLINTMLLVDRRQDAHKYWQKVLDIDPQNLHSLHNYANFQQETMNDYTLACEIFEKIAASDKYPALAQLYNDWAIALKNLGQYELAMQQYERSIAIRPQAHIYSNMLYDLLFSEANDNLEILQKHQQYPLLFQSTIAKKYSHSAVATGSKKLLRIGYISPDFRHHSVGMFCLNVLKNHDHEEFEIFCYYSCPINDEETVKFKECADHWRDVAVINHVEVAKMINNDKIDILVDLSGHTKGNAMQVFLAKPAPIQISWLGYNFSTGINDIDYFITDTTIAPVGMLDEQFSEKLLRMPGCFLTNKPHNNLPQVAETPAFKNGYITFGLCGNIAKINKSMIAIYTDVLKAVPGSKLLVKSAAMNDAAVRDNFYQLFAELGIVADRLLFKERDDSTGLHLMSLNSIDILLDWYPYNGVTITCEALSMGVPVVSLYGDSHRARVGLSILTALARPQWAAGNREEFVEIAVGLCSDVEALNRIRLGLRNEFLNSPLCDAKTFTAKLEQAYRDGWQRFCFLK